ncbi:MAG: gluconate 5-dehydrogenase [Burkholderiales bacterium PBB5]|nr:MAG: gluconate 5-dehydrogenase [Burkholderiales bacterium PBB5]
MSTPIQQLFDLSGRVALVTGGSRGLGLQIAEALGEAGAKIMLTSRKAADLEESAAHLAALGIDARWVAAAASQPEDVQRVVDATLQRLGLFSQAVARASMIARRHGRIINIASIAGLAGNPAAMETIAYNTSKGAVVNFTRALAAEWGEHGITVNAIAPGFFPTKMANGLIEMMGADKMAAAAPLRRLGDSDDLKGAAVLFASQAGKHITGQILPVDGGVSAVVGG